MEDELWQYPVDKETADWEAVFVALAATVICCGLFLIAVGVFS